MSERSPQAIAAWLKSNLGEPIGARSTALDSEGAIFRSDGDDVLVVPVSEAIIGGQAATCRARVTINGEQWDGEFAVRAELLESRASKRRTDAMWMAYIAARDPRAAEVLLRPWRTAEATVPAYAVRSPRDGTETVGLDIMQWADPFAAAFAEVSGEGRVDRAVDLAIRLFSGLDHIHERWMVVHRDIDTKNVMFAGRNLVLVDWGIVSTVTEGTSTITTAMGKEDSPYVAPETLAGRRIGRFTDAWALGVLLCTMACGEPPIVRDTGRREIELPAEAGDLPRWLRDIITGLTTHDRNERMTLKAAVAGLGDAGWNAITVGAPGGAMDPSTAITAPPATMAPTAQDGHDLAHRRARVKELLAEGYEHGRVGRPHDAMTAYSSAIDTCDGDPDPVLRQHMAMALNNTQWTLYNLGQHTEAVTTCSRLVDTFGHDADLLLRQQVAIAINSSGYSKRVLSLNERAIADWDEVVTRFGSDPDPVLRRQVAMALRDKGLALATLDRRVDALSSYTRLIESFEHGSDLVLRQQVAMALNNKRSCLYGLGHHTEALAACTRLVDVFGGDRDTVVRQQVAAALRSKGLILDRSRQREGALAAYGRLVDIFEHDPDPSVRESVEWARGRLRAGSGS
ncbi:MAG TPA: protein kinase [Dermatophilaceae bacterium]